MTPNQLVAYNLRRARARRGWTQEEAAERLAPYLGERWSKATFSVAERSAENGGRRRNFTADDVFAFARAFDLPIPYFFAPSPIEGEIAPEGATESASREQGFELCFAVPADVLVGREGVLELSAATTSALKRWAQTYADAAAERQREVDALLATRENEGEGAS